MKNILFVFALTLVALSVSCNDQQLNNDQQSNDPSPEQPLDVTPYVGEYVTTYHDYQNWFLWPEHNRDTTYIDTVVVTAASNPGYLYVSVLFADVLIYLNSSGEPHSSGSATPCSGYDLLFRNDSIYLVASGAPCGDALGGPVWNSHWMGPKL